MKRLVVVFAVSLGLVLSGLATIARADAPGAGDKVSVVPVVPKPPVKRLPVWQIKIGEKFRLAGTNLFCRGIAPEPFKGIGCARELRGKIDPRGGVFLVLEVQGRVISAVTTWPQLLNRTGPASWTFPVGEEDSTWFPSYSEDFAPEFLAPLTGRLRVLPLEGRIVVFRTAVSCRFAQDNVQRLQFDCGRASDVSPARLPEPGLVFWPPWRSEDSVTPPI